ncbi:putative reverse transcriptase domain-containing protein [Tanacetum coccineum]
MPPKRTATTTTPAPMTNAQIKALIAQGVADVLAKIEANKTSRNGDDNHDSGTSSRRTERASREEVASKPKIMQDAIEFATELTDQKIRSLTNHQAKNKRKFDDTSRDNQNQQQPFKRHNVTKAYTTKTGEKKVYGGSKPLCLKCNYHYDGQCAPKCTNCKRNGHLAQDCRSQPAAANNQRNSRANQRGITCYECGVQGHYKKDFPKLKNKNQGNQAENGNAAARAYVVVTTGTNPNYNVVMGTFLLNSRNASILLDTGTDRSFVSTALSSLIDIVPTTLDHGYDVELADDKII